MATQLAHPVLKELAGEIKRPGTAPTQGDAAVGSGTSKGGSVQQADVLVLDSMTSDAVVQPPLGARGSGGKGSDSDASAFLASPAYVQFYYANRNLNPRLPPPVFVGNRSRAVGDELASKQDLDSSAVAAILGSYQSQEQSSSKISPLSAVPPALQQFDIQLRASASSNGVLGEAAQSRQTHTFSGRPWGSGNLDTNLDTLLQAFSPRASQAGPNVFGTNFTDGGSNSSSKAASGNLAGPALLGALNAANRSNSGYLSAGGAGVDDLLSASNALNNSATGPLSNGGANVNSGGGAGAAPGSGGSATSLVDALFYAASGNLTPRTSVGSAAAFGDILSPTPNQSRNNSLTLPSSLAPRDPKTSLLRGMRAASAGPSKLRIGSTTNDIVAPIDSVSMGPNLTAAFSVDSAAALTPNRAASLADPELSGGGAADDEATLSDTMLQNLAAAVTAAVTEQSALDASAAAAAAGIMGGLGGGQGDGSSLDSQQHLQAMAYMASSAQQGGYVPTSSPPYFSGAAGTPFGSAAPVPFSAAPSSAPFGSPFITPFSNGAAAAGAGFGGFGNGMGGLPPGFPAPHIPGFPTPPGGMPFMSPAEYAVYYQKCMEAQAMGMAGLVPPGADQAQAMGIIPPGMHAPYRPGPGGVGLGPPGMYAPPPGVPGSSAPYGHVMPGPYGRVVVPVAAPWGVPAGPGAPVMPHMHPVAVGGGVAGGPVPSGLTPHHSHPHGRGMHPHHSLGLRAGGAAGNGAGPAGGNGALGALAGRAPPSSGATALLEEFKSNKGRKFEFSDLAGHLFEFCLDQHGSRFIQQKLETATSDQLATALDELLPRCLSLMTDVFGNYVVQKFLEHGGPEQRAAIAGVLKGQVLALSLQMYGCRVVQKALEVLDTDAQCGLVAELDGAVMKCVRDQNGNHVIQKVIECVPTHRIAPLIDNFLSCVVPLSTHPFGCRIVQRVLEHCSDAKRKAVVMEEILKATVQLAQDQYGNYVIQHVLERGKPDEKHQVINALAPHIVQLSMHKFASNVVEKCLALGAPADRSMLVKLMLGSDQAGVPRDGEAQADGPEGENSGDPLQQMMKDQFGNYCVQKLLEVCDDDQREALLGRVREQLSALRKYTYGKHVVARVEKLLSAGTKIQSHLRSRPLPDDTATLASVAPVTGGGGSNESSTAVSPTGGPYAVRSSNPGSVQDGAAAASAAATAAMAGVGNGPLSAGSSQLTSRHSSFTTAGAGALPRPPVHISQSNSSTSATSAESSASETPANSTGSAGGSSAEKGTHTGQGRRTSSPPPPATPEGITPCASNI